MKKTNRKMLIIVLLLAILLCLYFVANTYSKYTSTSESNSTVTAAKWSISVNDTDVSSGNTFDENKLLKLTPIDSTKVATGTIAPTSSVQGTIELDPTGTQVALKYKIKFGTITYSGSKTAPEITISGVTVKVGSSTTSTTLTQNIDGDYEGTIALPASNGTTSAMTSDQIQNITVTATWKESDDTTDTAVGIEAGTITVPVTVTVEQDV